MRADHARDRGAVSPGEIEIEPPRINHSSVKRLRWARLDCVPLALPVDLDPGVFCYLPDQDRNCEPILCPIFNELH
jgi:hypothetical protein